MDVEKEEVRAPLKTFVMVFLFVIGAVASSVTWGLAIKEQVNVNRTEIVRIEQVELHRIEMMQEQHNDTLCAIEERMNKKDIEYAEIQRDLKYIIEKIEELRDNRR